MFRRRKQRTSDDGERGNTLSRLLASEDQLATRLDQAREEAERILADAARYVQDVESSCARLIQDRTSLLEGERALKLEAELESIRADAEQEGAVFTGAAQQRLPELVARVLANLIATGDLPRSSRA